MQEAFEAIGYDTDWRILNAVSYGVPQKRERLVMIGVERGGPLSYPPPTHGGNLGPTIGFRERERMHGVDGQASLFGPSQPASSPLLSLVTVAHAIDALPPIGNGEEATAYDRPPRTRFQEDRRASSGRLELHSPRDTQLG
jgi:DNA (cytosine-5)-methyltransferase 1